LMEEVAEHINNCMKSSDNVKKIFSIQESFIRGSCPRLVVPSRVFIKEGFLTEIKNENRTKKLQIFLFNDMIIFAMPLILNRFVYKNQGPIIQTFVMESEESQISPFCFRIQTPSKTRTVFVSTLREKQEWIKVINDVREKQQEMEGARVVLTLLKKEEERIMLDNMKQQLQQIQTDPSLALTKPSLTGELQRIMMEREKLDKVKQNQETMKKKAEEESVKKKLKRQAMMFTILQDEEKQQEQTNERGFARHRAATLATMNKSDARSVEHLERDQSSQVS